MPRVSPAIVSFNAGELSPEMEGRTDLDKYQSGCKLLENFIPLVQGPIRRRGGTRVAAPLKVQSSTAKLDSFQFSATQGYILEFSHLKLRIYKDALVTSTGNTVSSITKANPGVVTAPAHGLTTGQTVLFTAGSDGMRELDGRYFTITVTGVNAFSIGVDTTNYHTALGLEVYAPVYEVVSPYSLADLTSATGATTLQMQQSGDVLYIAVPGYLPRKLTRLAEASWVFSIYDPDNGPFLDLNDTTTVMYVSAIFGSVTIIASAAVWNANDVGRLVRIDQHSYIVSPWETGKAVNSGDLRVYNGHVYKAMNSATTASAAPVHTDGTQSDGAVYWTYQDSGYGIARITAYTSATQVTADVKTQFPTSLVGSSKTITGATAANPVVITAVAHGFATNDQVYITGIGGMTQINNRWFHITVLSVDTFSLTNLDGSAYTAYTSGGSAIKNASAKFQLGAWGMNPGYPASVSFWRNRLWFSSGIYVFGTVASDFESMAQDDFGLQTDANAIYVNLQANEVNEINWLAPSSKLLIGTSGGVFALGEITTSDPLSPTNTKIELQEAYRAHDVPPVAIGGQIHYLQATGKKMRAIAYDYTVDSYDSEEATVLSSRMLAGQVIDHVFVADPVPTDWCALKTGELVALTKEGKQDVTGWHRHPIGGNGLVESVAKKVSSDGTREELWLLVKRTVNGATTRTVEVMQPEWLTGDDRSNAFYVDGGKTYRGNIKTVVGVEPTLTWTSAAATIGASVTLTANAAHGIDANDIGKHIIVPYIITTVTLTARGAIRRSVSSQKNGRALITARDATTITATVISPFPTVWTVPGDSTKTRTLVAQGGEWYLSTTSIQFADHLEGETVQVLVHGAVHPDVVVTGGVIALNAPAAIVHYGKQYSSVAVKLRLEAGSADGTAQGKTKRIHDAVMRFLETLGGYLGLYGGTLDEIQFRDTAMSMDNPPPMFTGDKNIPFPGDYESDAEIEVRQDQQLPMTVVGIYPGMKTYDR